MLSAPRNLSLLNQKLRLPIKLNNRTAKIVVNALGFQLIWTVSVLFGDLWAVVVTLSYVLLHHFMLVENSSEWVLVAFVTLIGSSTDTVFEKLGVFEFATTAVWVPLWLVCLWLGFATTLKHALAWLQNKLILASALGAIAGPFSYYAGAQLSGVELAHPLWQTLLILSMWWACLMPIAMRFARTNYETK